MSKQTAVEWLGYELNTKLFYNITPELWEQVNAIFEQAKAMEKEQMIDFVIKIPMDLSIDEDGNPSVKYNPKQYYNETYGGDK